jgi:hypothetical protein
MANVFLRPDLITAGGEISDILYDGRYVGSLSLVYREFQRVSGAIQLDQPSLLLAEKDYVLRHIQSYMTAFASSVEAEECTLFVSYSPVEYYEDHYDLNAEDEDLEDEGYYEDLDEEIETLDMGGHIYHLVIVGEGRSKIEYHIYDEEQDWVAEVLMEIHGEVVSGEVHWLYYPTEVELEAVTELLLSDFDEESMDKIVFDHRFEKELIETIEFVYQEMDVEPSEVLQSKQDMDYTVVLARDDEDILTYEIFEESHGHFPIGIATVDISKRILTGFIDFRESESSDNLDKIAALLMLELDKEKEYDGIHLTTLYQNEPIDEISIDCKQMH